MVGGKPAKRGGILSELIRDGAMNISSGDSHHDS